MGILIESYVLGAVTTNCYVVTDKSTGDILVVDPALYSGRLLGAVESRRDRVKRIVLTHRHFDHLLGVAALKADTGALVAIHGLDAEGLTDPAVSLAVSAGMRQTPVTPDVLLRDGDTFNLGESPFTVVHTPGHTAGGICLCCDNQLFTGDTIFAGDVGRCDLPTGDYKTLKKSLKRIGGMENLRDIYPGHGPGASFSHELKTNIYLKEAMNEI